jgi:hypothetical protein
VNRRKRKLATRRLRQKPTWRRRNRSRGWRRRRSRGRRRRNRSRGRRNKPGIVVIRSLLEKFVLSTLGRFRRKRRDLFCDGDVGLVEGRTLGGCHHDILEIGTAGCVRIDPFLERAVFQFVECEYVYGIQR